jgi:lipoprotein signal peptidase
VQPSVLSHERPFALYAVAVALASALLLLTPRVGSRLVSVGSGLAAGGALAIAVCGLAWPGGVPNPLSGGDVAFNLADLAIASGVATLVVGVVVHAWRNRARLSEPV